MRRAFLLACCALLAGCCTGPSYMALAYNPRIELEQRRTFALVAPVLSDTAVWAYGTPAQRIAAREDAYRPGPTRGPQRGVGALSEAPSDVVAALEQVKRTLTELGYRPFAAGGPAGGQEDFIVSVALSWHDDGRLARAAVHVGAELDGRFDPHAISLAAVLAENDSCPVTASELTGELVSFFPAYGEAP